MRCPNCGSWVESVTWKALRPYRGNTGVVLSNVDCLCEVGDEFAFIIEEKQSRQRIIRGFQLVFLRKLADQLDIPAFVVYDHGNVVTVYEVPEDLSGNYHPPFYSFEEEIPVFTGSVEELGEWLYREFLVHAPLSRPLRRLWR